MATSSDGGDIADGNASTFIWHFQRVGSLAGRRFAPFAIVGQHADGTKEFVQHVALLASECELTSANQVSIWHMGPPLTVTEVTPQNTGGTSKCRADLMIDIPLSSDERKGMLHWRAKVDKERRPNPPFQQYIIDPPIHWVRSELGRKLFRRFSCAGFVMSAYAAAGISLINPNAVLPEVSRADVERAYPQLIRVLEMKPSVRTKLGFTGMDALGLPGLGPWRIVLAGYLFHSCRRSTRETPRPDPYCPSSVAEAYFPPVGKRAQGGDPAT